MSVYKPKKSPFYAFDFQLDGRRFHGSTGAKGRREAEKVESEEREKAKQLIAAEKAIGGGPLTIDLATARYWTEIGQHHAGADTTWTNLGRLVDFFGPAKLLAEITDDDVAKLVTWRRSQTVKGRRSICDLSDPKRKRKIAAPLVSATTVNRSTIEPLQKVFNRAALVWGLRFSHKPTWKRHLLAEPKERVREVRAHEESAIEEAVRSDYLPLVRFARAAGLRLSECLLKKDAVDLHAGRIRTRGKGGKEIDHPITSEMRAILMEEMANPTDSVFTYAAARAKRRGRKVIYPQGTRIPITQSGLKTIWRRSRMKKGGKRLPPDLRFHDLRHDFATKLLRETGNLKLVQRALHHSKVETTTRYAHVLDEEVLKGMEAAAERRRKTKRT